jgi:uncharacterized surface protein with fasciclin (FAS1) repeats
MQYDRFVTAAVAAVFVAAAPLAALAQASNAPPAAGASTPTVQLAPHGDIAETLKASDQFTILGKALDATNLTGVLKRPGPLTLFAPTDAAFKALPPAELDDLLKPENAGRLQALLAYHVINAAVPPSAIQGAKGPVRTVAGRDVQIDGSGAPIKINGANVEGQASVSNGSIYVIDQVLTPPVAAAAAAAANTAG